MNAIKEKIVITLRNLIISNIFVYLTFYLGIITYRVCKDIAIRLVIYFL